jgi:predicted ATP-dependent endonuclease of OLD family
MKIDCFVVQNFRKLECCKIELAENKTLFVGANNSGKTSAMDALRLFLKQTEIKDKIKTSDFTLSNWIKLNKMGKSWLKEGLKNEDETLNEFRKYVPSLDVWLDVSENKIHYISHLIPTLSWAGGGLGVRLIFEPDNIEKLYSDFKNAFEEAEKLKDGKDLKLWPLDLKDFLDRKFLTYIKLHSYILDPLKKGDVPQILSENDESIGGDPFKGLFKIDIINAQRVFSDGNDYENIIENCKQPLSDQFHRYYEKHLDASEYPEVDDIEALYAVQNAKETFDKKLRVDFKEAVKELESLNYPGFYDPSIQINSKLDPAQAIKHKTAVQFKVFGDDTCRFNILPEKYNGLGYQNLISMVFKLIRFRDEWMRVGKAKKKELEKDKFIEPLHVVLIEEPEAHLHVQVQQVFMRKAYEVLRSDKNNILGDKKDFRTQLVVSTHSSNIAHEVDFNCLRYFRRVRSDTHNEVPTAEVVNLTETFGKENDETSKFVTRYIKTTHCDLFFADAVILVEGAAERMLLPHFIRNRHKELYQRYISILELGGSHAHRLRNLVERLGVTTLIITDLDSIESKSKKKVLPERKHDYISGNTTLEKWIPKENNLDKLFDLDGALKLSDCGKIRVAYQCPFMTEFDSQDKKEAIPYTFEDAFALSNIDLIKKLEAPTGLLKKMQDALLETNLQKVQKKMFEELKIGNKAQMSLDIIYSMAPEKVSTPQYIKEGLEWLKKELRPAIEGSIVSEESREND